MRIMTENQANLISCVDLSDFVIPKQEEEDFTGASDNTTTMTK